MLYSRFIFLSFIMLVLPCTVKANTILVMGDSLSAAYGIDLDQGWVNLMNNKLDQIQNDDTVWNVVNASVSGETTAGALARLPDLLKKHQPALCIIELGANDGLRGQSVSQMREHLNQMITQCRVYGEVLLLGMKLPPNYGLKYTASFNQSYTDIAEKNDIPLVPFMLEGIAVDENYFQADQFHPTAKAQSIILANIWPTLLTVLKSLE